MFFFFVGVQNSSTFVLQTTQIISDVYFITDHVAYPAQIKSKLSASRQTLLFYFLPGVDASHVYVRALGARLPPQSYWYPDLWEGADRVAGQLRGDKECPFSGVTGRVWRKVPESAARSVQQTHSFESYFQDCGRKLLQITRQQAHRGVNSKMAVEHYYTSHNNRHTARSLISKTAVEHYYKSHNNRQLGVLFARQLSNIITNHTTTDIHRSYLQDGGQISLQMT